MRTPLSTGGDLGKFIVAEFDRRGITISNTRDLPQLLASWRARETPEGEDRPRMLTLSVRGCTFGQVADFCTALFVSARRRWPHVRISEQSAVGATLLVEAHPGVATDTEQDFSFDVPGGSGQFSRGDSSVVVFVRVVTTTSFILSHDESGVHIAFIDHNAA